MVQKTPLHCKRRFLKYANAFSVILKRPSLNSGYLPNFGVNRFLRNGLHFVCLSLIKSLLNQVLSLKDNDLIFLLAMLSNIASVFLLDAIDLWQFRFPLSIDSTGQHLLRSKATGVHCSSLHGNILCSKHLHHQQRARTVLPSWLFWFPACIY